jgi:hypothetical protein
MDKSRIRTGYQSNGKLILPNALTLNSHDLYSIKSDTRVKGRKNLMQAQDEAALRYEILTGDVHVVR